MKSVNTFDAPSPMKMAFLACMILLGSMLNACSEAKPPLPKAQKNSVSTVVQPVPFTTNVQNYDAFLQSVKSKRRTLAPQSRGPTLYSWVHNDMARFWDDTVWAFYGMSRVAGEGEIACGYFVTTALQDIGFQIDRIRLAQEPSATMIKELTTQIKILYSREDMVAYVETQPTPAIYIVGLDFHTGFISSGEDGIYFIHSNYIGREGVVKELAARSAALADSDYFMIGNLTANTELLEKWSSNP